MIHQGFIASILTLVNVSWKQNDNEMTNITFEDYDWNKCKNKLLFFNFQILQID